MKNARGFAHQILIALALMLALLVTSSIPGQPAAGAGGANLAPVAVASASFVSGDTTLKALSDGVTPRNSQSSPGNAYGNWNRTGTQWVQYDWKTPISTNKIEVYWWSDGGGIQFPAASRLKYWNGSAFVPVTNAKGLGVAGNRFNETTFDEVQTTRLRLEFDSGAGSTGILEWRVIDSGKSPKFPPSVDAGIERVVVLDGSTYLDAKVKALSLEPPALTWSKASGPGAVTFADPKAASTSAKFSKTGDYVLKLTAADGNLSGAGELKVKVTDPPPAKTLNVVYTKKYSIDSPLWNERAKALIASWIPHCIDELSTVNPQTGDGGIVNFINAANKLAGKPYEPQKGYVFSNAFVVETVEAMCIALMVDPKGDPEMIKAQAKMSATLEDWIPKILAAQMPDGYMQTAIQLGNGRRWTDNSAHEGYIGGYFIESAINHYTLTNGKDLRLYDAAKKLADCWCNNIGPGKKKWYDGHEEMEQALVRFGRFVNDQEGAGHGDRYIQLAKFLLDCRGGGDEYDQSHLPVIQQYEAVGHAVRAVYCYSGMADVAAETHNPDYQSAVASLWDNIVNKKYYVTGGVGSGETSEGFGPDYSLRNNSYCESCSSAGEIFFQWKMNLAYHDAKYVDRYEETMYNALLGATDLAGTVFNYTNPLVGGERTAWHVCPCCVSNISRTLLMVPTWTYAKDDTGLYVNMFVGSTINVEKVAGTDVQMVQKTNYPWDGKVAITVNPAATKRFTVHVRVPNRQTSEIYTDTPEVSGLLSLAVNGAKVEPKIVNGYAEITREWKAGDKIEFELPMKVQKIHAIEQVEADRGRVALRYGPLVYNIEGVDQNINLPLARDAALTPEWRGDLLGGVMVIKGTFADGSPMLAIPNFARNNRNGSQTARGARVGGNAGVDYSGRSGGAVRAGAPARRGGNGSIVWIAEK